MLLPHRDVGRNEVHRATQPRTQHIQSLTRRTVLGSLMGGIAITLAAPSIARAETGRRSFQLVRGTSDIGTQTLSVTKSGAELIVDIAIDLRVRLLGITVYRYEMTNTERWADGRLISMDSNTKENDGSDFSRVSQAGDGLEIEGSNYSGPAPADVGTSTYWTSAFLRRPKWINTQNGELLDMTVRNVGASSYQTANGPVNVTGWDLGWDAGVTCYYTGSGEWTGCTFDARGELVRYIPDSLSPAIAPLWS